MRFYIVLLMFLLPFTYSFGQTYSVNLKIKEIRSSKGRIQIQIFKSHDAFETEDAWRILHVSKKGMKNKMLEYTITDMPKGEYGIAILDDENEDDIMNYSFFLPKEGFGFAGYYHKGMKKPRYNDFKFQLEGNADMDIVIRYVK